MRIALGHGDGTHSFFENLSKNDWLSIYALAKRETVLGITYAGISKLPKKLCPPFELALIWANDAETYRGLNRLLNETAVQLTNRFDTEGVRSAILKGQANARLYPDPLLRQPGDIDIYVPGGKSQVQKLLHRMGLLDSAEKNVDFTLHHFHLPKTPEGVSIEVHYKPVKPVLGNPLCARAMQHFLREEALKAERVPEGFFAPSIPFALIMQLSHLQQHFFSTGVGLRQFADYYVLLQHSTEEERKQAMQLIHRFHMQKVCSAVMWVLETVFHLGKNGQLCAPRKYYGRKILEQTLLGGNFGKYDAKNVKRPSVFNWMYRRLRAFRWFAFDPLGTVLQEIHYWITFCRMIPLRLRLKRIFL